MPKYFYDRNSPPRFSRNLSECLIFRHIYPILHSVIILITFGQLKDSIFYSHRAYKLHLPLPCTHSVNHSLVFFVQSTFNPSHNFDRQKQMFVDNNFWLNVKLPDNLILSTIHDVTLAINLSFRNFVIRQRESMKN